MATISGYDVHHVDGDTLNNSILNLEYIPHEIHSSISCKGRKLSPEHIQKIVNARIGWHHTEESKTKMSEALKGKPSPMKGKHQSAEAKAKLSSSIKAYWEKRRQQA